MESKNLCGLLCLQSSKYLSRNYEFERFGYGSNWRPTPDSIESDDIFSIELICSSCSSISPMLKEFDATSSGIITKLPKDYKIIKSQDVMLISYGKDVDINGCFIDSVKIAGMLCGWNDNNFVIGASKEYIPALEKIESLIQPWKCRLSIQKYHFIGSKFVISKADIKSAHNVAV